MLKVLKPPRMKKFGPQFGLKKFADGGDTAMTPEEKSRQKQAQREADAARRQREADMDRKMREASERFKRSPENDTPGYRKGGKVKKHVRGGGIEQRGKTRGKFV